MARLIDRAPRLRDLLIRAMVWLIRRKFKAQPIHVEENGQWTPVFLTGVTFTASPEGVTFFLKCHSKGGPTFIPSHLSSSRSRQQRVWNLDYRTLKFSDGKWRSISPIAPPAA